jgi:hypothetical protein
MDAKYIESIYKLYGSGSRLKTFPNLWLSRWLKWIIVNRIKKIRPLYYIDYHKNEVKEFMTEKYGWKWYGGHHMENRTAYFTNNYYLPKKFGIDLRYCEFSALIRSGQMTRENALKQILEKKIFDNGILEEVKKRLELSDRDFESIMALPKKTYRDYKTYKETFETLKPFFWGLYKLNLVPQSFYLKYTKKYDN